MPKEGLPLVLLLKNASKVLGRKLTLDRTVKVTKYFAQPGVKVFRVNGEAKGEKETYDLNINFQQVSFSEEKDKKHPYSVPTAGGKVFMEQLYYGRHTVKVWCSCTWFRFACFPGDTLIKMADGSICSISTLAEKENFDVYSYDLESKKITTSSGLNCTLIEKDAPLLEITFDNGNSIRCTYDHKFLLANGLYEEAQNLDVNILLQGYCEGEEKLVYVKSIVEYGCEDVYCFEVPDNHNFLLDIGDNQGVFVHNCEWYLHQHNSLFPRRKPRPYKKVAGSNRKSINPDQLACACKHIYQLGTYIKDIGVIK